MRPPDLGSGAGVMHGEDLEQVRQAVREAYGTKEPLEPQAAAVSEALGRARGLAGGDLRGSGGG